MPADEPMILTCGEPTMVITRVLVEHHGKSSAYIALKIAEALGLAEEIDQCYPVSVPDVDSDGKPLMDERWHPPIQRHHFEWVARQRWSTPWVEISERETSVALSERLEAMRAAEKAAHG